MKKIFQITLIDGQKFEIDMKKVIPDLPINIQPNDNRLLKLTCDLCQEGFCPNMQSDRPLWIAPSQIKQIEIVFEKEEVLTLVQ